MSFIFYDTETTGTHTAFDQILQFAAIYTDEELNEIERFEIRCRLLPNIVPSPGAMRVTRLKVSQLTDTTLPSHYEMMCSIRQKLLEWSPSTFLGYNTIKFDENLLRQAFYQTLHPLYLTNTLGNSRTDIMRIAQAASVYAPGALVIPNNADGKPNYKLDRLAPANGFEHEDAHEALSDVEATLHIAKLILKRSPDVWSAFMRFSTKAAVADYASNEQAFCLTEFYYGDAYSWLVAPLGASAMNSSEFYVYNLGVDPNSLSSLKNTELIARLNTLPKPVRTIRTNAAPMIFSLDDAPHSASGKSLSQEELDRRVSILEADLALKKRLITVFEQTKQEWPASPHVEEQIYNGFYQRDDEELREAFHTVDWTKRKELVERFEDQRLKKLGSQLIYAEQPEVLDPTLRLKHDREIAKKIAYANPELPWLTLPEALEEIEVLINSASNTERLMLIEHQKYLAKRLNEVLAILEF